jgi:hypothetical protein
VLLERIVQSGKAVSNASGKKGSAITLDSLKHIGEARDGALVIGGILYVLGYIVWSINAWKNKLGLLPALDAQYFIAGIIPTLIIVLVYIGIRFSLDYSRPLPDWINPAANLIGWKLVLRRVLLTVLYIVYLLPAVMSWTKWPQKYFPSKAALIFGVGAALSVAISVGYLFFYNKPPAKEKPTFSDRAGQFYRTFMRIMIVTLIGFLALNYYLNLLYSKLPQAMGGVRPRCAYLDVVRNDVSQDTLKALVPPEASAPISSSGSPGATAPHISPVGSIDKGGETLKSETVRSVPVEMLFSGSDYTILRVGGNVFELKKDVIRAIDYCN